MTKPWIFVPEDSENWPHMTRNPEDSMHREGEVFFRRNWGPTAEQGALWADALNVHDATGLTPSQLQARVAELEAIAQKVPDLMDKVIGLQVQLGQERERREKAEQEQFAARYNQTSYGL